MPDWMKDLEKLVKGMGKDKARDEDEYEGDEDEGGDDEEEEEDETPAPRPRARKSQAAGVCDPKPNAETTDTGGEASVHDPKSLDRRTGGGAAPVRKSIEDFVSDEAADALEVSSVLGELAKGCNALAGANDSRFQKFEQRLARLEKGIEAIGTAVTKGLQLQVNTEKSLREDVDAISRQPAGRKSVTKSVERKFAGNEGDAAALPTVNEILTKSMKAFKAGAIDARTVSALETARQCGKWAEVAGTWERIKDL